MRGDYHLNEAEIAYWRPLLEEKIKEICEQELYLPLKDYDLSPANVHYLLRDVMGYEQLSFDSNGWEQDTWYRYKIPDTDIVLVMYYCGFTFDFTLSRDWEDGASCDYALPLC